MNAVIYARYSPGGDQTDQSIEGQLRECREFADRNDITIVGIYADHAMTGRNDHRPDFLRMIADSESGKFEAVIVWKLDRFARNRYDSAIYKAKLKKNGVKIISAKENITDSPEGIILEAMLEGMAEYYSANLSQNIKRGMKESALKCQVTGGNIAAGYKIGPNKEFVVDPPQAAIVKEIFERYDRGETVTQIITALNERGLKTSRGNPFGPNSLHTILKNEKYIGVYKWNDVVIEGGVPAIIDKDLFERVQEKMKLNKKAPARASGKADYLLSTKLFCGKCGTNMNGESGTSRTKGRKHYYYKCASAKRRKGCDKKPVKKDWIEDLVVSETVRRIINNEDVIQFIADGIMELQGRERDKSVLRALEMELEGVKKSIANLVKAVEMGIFSESTQARLAELEQEKKTLEGRIAHEEIITPKVTREQVVLWLEQFKDVDVNDPEDKKMIIDTFVKAVFVYDDHITITYNVVDEKGRPRTVNVEKSAFPADPVKSAEGSTLTSFPPPKQDKANPYFEDILVFHDCFALIIKIADRV